MTAKEAGPPTEETEHPTFICDFCGPQKPAVKVFQCTVCLKSFCVEHLGTWAHDCYQNE